MKLFRRILCMLLVLFTVGILCACGSSSTGTGSTSTGTGSKSKTPEEEVRSAVESRGMFAYFGSSIGGNELKSSYTTITNVKKVSDTQYIVSGKIVMTDIYGTNWNNTFDCTVRKSGESWSAGSFEYTSKNWTKG